ncbi:hypothetical protein LJR289_002550 [Pseudoduganella sp. LjRoot289]|uniref:hypothetical protein n=1 Tax=Pseudoduganella sp. LjRoot289 TaxID=3342314 RepID=UPI003ECE9E2F
MQDKRNKSIFASFSGMFANESLAKKPIPAMRPLNEEELRAVAGGPECDVGNGN